MPNSFPNNSNGENPNASDSRAEAEAATQKLLDNIFETVPAGVVYLDKDLKIQQFNSSARRAVGALGEIAGKQFFDVCATPHSGLAFAFKKVLSENQSLTFWGFPISPRNVDQSENAAANADQNSKTYWDYTLYPLDGGVLLFAVEVTDRIRAERGLQDAIEAARQSSGKLQSVIEQMTDGVVVCDGEARATTVNDAALRLFGDAASVLDENAPTVDSPLLRRADDATIFPIAEYPWRLACAAGKTSVNVEIEVRRSAHENAIVSVNAAPLRDKNNRLIGAIAVLHDVTENRRLIFELREANRRLEEYNQLKAEFVANMSHELRTPLTAIIGFANLLQLKMKTGAIEQAAVADGLERILRNGRHLLQLVDEILDFSKLEAGRLMLHPDYFELPDLIEKAFGGLESLAIAKGLEFNLQIEPDLPPAYSDPARIRQIVLNLLSNAIKFTARGAVTARLAAHSETEWKLTVSDTGKGIGAIDLKTIFERFRQVDGSLTRSVGGVGLGLSISQQLAELLGGKITVESELGVGSSFTLTLPFVAAQTLIKTLSDAPESDQSAAEAQTETREPAAKQTNESDARPLVLVIDDTTDAALLLADTLENAGFAVKTADSGAEGLKLARELCPAAITLDIMMPGMDGWRVLQELKNNQRTAQIPVIVCSIVDNQPLGYRLGASGYLIKPIESSSLLRALQTVGTTPDDKPDDYVLVVDDEHGVRELLIAALKQNGFAARSAASGEIAFALAMQKPPLAILTDLHMPGGMSGYELIARLRAQAPTAQTPIVVVTGKDLTGEDRRFINKQIADVIRKGDLLLRGVEERLRETLAEIGVEPTNGSNSDC